MAKQSKGFQHTMICMVAIRTGDNVLMSPTYQTVSRTHNGCNALFIRGHIDSDTWQDRQRWL